MNWVDELLILQTIGLGVAAISVVIGVTSWIQTNRHAQMTRDRELETRQAQLFMQLYDRRNSREFQGEYNEIVYL